RPSIRWTRSEAAPRPDKEKRLGRAPMLVVNRPPDFSVRYISRTPASWFGELRRSNTETLTSQASSSKLSVSSCIATHCVRPSRRSSWRPTASPLPIFACQSLCPLSDFTYHLERLQSELVPAQSGTAFARPAAEVRAQRVVRKDRPNSFDEAIYGRLNHVGVA